MRDILRRNVIILFFAQMVFVSGSILMVTLGGIIGNELAGNPLLATLPLSLMVIGIALTTIPASLIMQKIGRRRGFAMAAAVATGAALLAAWALTINNFVVFCMATFTIGSTLAFSQQFRFGAAESVPTRKISYAISFILLGSIGGAFLGPEIVARSSSMSAEYPFRAAMLCLAVMYASIGLVLLLMKPIVITAESAQTEPERPLRRLFSQPMFICAVAAGVVGQGVMTFIMTATPLSMHVVDGHSIADTAGVIRAHVIAMYLPSLISGPLIARFGSQKLMSVGVVAMLATIGFGLSGHEVMHYWLALMLLGIGWNFLFVGGTTQLIQTYRSSERFKAQAFNEFSIFSVSALASLLAGTLIHQFGWSTLLFTAMGPLVLMLVILVWASRAQRSVEAKKTI